MNSSRFLLDIENTQEKCTPYMLAVLSEQFEIAQLLAQSMLSNMYHKNEDNKNVFDIAADMKIVPVLKYCMKL